VTLEQFVAACDLISLAEVDKACYLAFFYLRTKKQDEFSLPEAAGWLVSAGAAQPNRTRLGDRLRDSDKTIRSPRGFRLSLKFINELDDRFPQLSEKSQDVMDLGTILPPPDYQKTRGYIESIAKQINAAYEHNIFDGCAVLMRRLVEILLILSYQKLNIDAEIKDGAGNYLLLDGIISNAKNNTTLNLSRNGKVSVEEFRKLGNFAAHKIEYTCRREYIREHIQAFRALVTELLHKSGIRV
jgi:hypothetical protein